MARLWLWPISAYHPKVRGPMLLACIPWGTSTGKMHIGPFAPPAFGSGTQNPTHLCFRTLGKHPARDVSARALLWQACTTEKWAETYKRLPKRRWYTCVFIPGWDNCEEEDVRGNAAERLSGPVQFHLVWQACQTACAAGL